MMKILITTPIFPPEIGGPAVYTREVSRRLKEKGHQIRVVAFTSAEPEAEDLEIMRIIDEQYLKTPTYGSRTMRNHLRRLGYKINRKRVQRLMQRMGIEAIYPRPKTSKPHPEHRIYPYLLKGMDINQPNMVWATDITYIPMKRGFMYLVAVMDWYSRKVLSWQLSNTLDADFCVAALEEAIDRYDAPEIFNTDQGAQFTGSKFTDVLKSNNIRISMDGRGRAYDNIFVERLWWTVKYHYVYLHEFGSGLELREGIGDWFELYNQDRPHHTFNGKTPDEVYYGIPVSLKAA
jgi:putative transposase